MSRSVSPERTQQILTLFEQVVGLDPDARRAYLDQACAEDPQVRREVEALLEADTQTGITDELDEAVKTSFVSWLKASEPQEGQMVSHYEILEKLGGGGMGVVYKARDLKLDRTVALKFLPPHLSLDDEVKQRFIQEAKAASGLDHPNICTIYEIGETEAHQLFIAMAFYEGQMLQAKIERGPMPVEEAIDYAVQVAEGLSRAHASGIVHRDIKPANVIVTEQGRVKLLDFGLAKVADVSLTKAGSRPGTVAYMSPEQTHGKAVDARTDLWSLGVVLYEMLTGVRPFPGDNEQAVIYSILNQDPEPLHKEDSEVPEELTRMVEKLLSKDPNARYASAEALLAELRLLSSHLPAKAGLQQRKLAAIMFTDMVGYSALTQTNESLALALLEEHRRLLRPLFPKHGGREIETIGDAFFVEFASALEAVRCAVAIQRALFTRNESVSEQKQIKIRIGVHLGDVVVRGENVLGDGVNIAARVEPLAKPGGICISEDVARQVQNKIELPLQKLGKKRLKNIRLPMDVYAVELPWMREAVFDHVPAQTTQVIESDEEDDAVRRVLQRLRSKSRRFKIATVGSALLLIATIIGILTRSPAQEGEILPQWTQLVRLTTQPGLEDEPSWSPDGRSLAYTSDEGGYLSIWIRRVDGERALRIGKEGVDEAQPAWSPDDRYIAFVSSRNRGGRLGIFLGSRPIESHVYGQNGDLYIMPALGGTARKLADDAYDPSWSPDGSRLAFRSISDGSWRIYTISVDEGEIELVPGVEPRVTGLSWSPDGKWIAYIAGASAATGWDL